MNVLNKKKLVDEINTKCQKIASKLSSTELIVAYFSHRNKITFALCVNSKNKSSVTIIDKVLYEIDNTISVEDSAEMIKKIQKELR